MLDFLILSDSYAWDGEMTVFLFVMTSFRRDTVIRCAIQIRQTNASFLFFFLPYLQSIIISIETERCVILPSFNMTHDFSLTAHAFNDTQLGAMLSLP